MNLVHMWGLFTHPAQEWSSIRREHPSVFQVYLNYFVLAAIPPVSLYFGTTVIGWKLPGSQDAQFLTANSAASMALCAYCATLTGLYVMGAFIHWMAKTFDSSPTRSQCVSFAAYITMPILVLGISGLMPSLWIAMIAGLIAVTWATYLLYTGLPVFMGISSEQGFIFSSSVLAVALVVLVSIIASTVLLWSFGIGPVYR